MPAHHLNHRPASGQTSEHATAAPSAGMVNPPAAVCDLEQATVAVLGGMPVVTAAEQVGMAAADVADAVALYQAAGRAALAARMAAGAWHQVNVEFAGWDTAENTVAAALRPQLREAGNEAAIGSWWYVRKFPCWRLRLQAGEAGTAAMTQAIAAALDDLTRRGPVTRWWTSIYEPETLAFGGAAGITTAHRLFHADSTHILDHLNHAGPNPPPELTGRRELSILLCTALLGAAQQDWHEQGDVWHRVAQMRPLPLDTPTDRLHHTTGQVRQLLSLDTSPPPSPAHDDSPLASVREWLAAFTDAGHALGVAARDGTLRRGVRDVLAHHVIFHWNRLGLPTTAQAVLAHAATAATLSPTQPAGDGADVARA